MSQLLETGYNEPPNPESLGRKTVERRANRLVEGQEEDEYWDGESDSLRDLMETHGVEA